MIASPVSAPFSALLRPSLLVDSFVTRALAARIPTSKLVALINVSEPQQRGHRSVFRDLKSHVSKVSILWYCVHGVVVLSNPPALYQGKVSDCTIWYSWDAYISQATILLLFVFVVVILTVFSMFSWNASRGCPRFWMPRRLTDWFWVFNSDIFITIRIMPFIIIMS